MSVELFVAKRYLTSSKENRTFSWNTTLSIVGVAIGVAALIVVISIFNGFERELRTRFLAANAHILVFDFRNGLRNPDQWAAKVKEDFGKEITGTSPFIQSESMARKDSLLNSVLLRGISPRERENVHSLKTLVKPASALDLLQKDLEQAPDVQQAAAPPIIVGSGLLSLLDAKIGDRIMLVSPESDKLGELRPFEVVGTYDSGLKHYDNKIVLVSLTTAQKMFRMQGRVTGIEVGLKDPGNSPEVARRMEGKYTIQIKEWQSFNSSLFSAMETERTVISAIVFLVSFVAGFNILTALFISVTQRQKSISILKSIGANNRQIQRLFLVQGALVGLVGSLVGNVLALIVSQILQRWEIIELPDLYLLATLPVTYDPWTYATVTAGGVGIALIAGIYPALVASRVTPTDGFKGNRGFV